MRFTFDNDIELNTLYGTGLGYDEAKHAAGMVYVAPDGAVLLLKRGDKEENYAGHWALPGGGLEPGETPGEGADRESQEEMGVVPKGEKQLVHQTTTPNGLTFHTYKCLVDRKFKPKLNDEHSEYKWVTLNDLPEPMHPAVRDMLLGQHFGMDAKLDHKQVDYGPGKPEAHCRICEFYINDKKPACQLVEPPIEPTGWCKLFEDDEKFKHVKVDYEHDGPWMSCMSKDGETMYQNRFIPKIAEIEDKLVPTTPILKVHEVGEIAQIKYLLGEFKKEHGREPNVSERKQIYLKAHNSHGTPPERAYVIAKYGEAFWDKWSAWCRGEETKIEKRTPINPPKDEDVKPIPHGHGDLEITMDRSIRAGSGETSINSPKAQAILAKAKAEVGGLRGKAGTAVRGFEKRYRNLLADIDVGYNEAIDAIREITKLAKDAKPRFYLEADGAEDFDPVSAAAYTISGLLETIAGEYGGDPNIEEYVDAAIRHWATVTGIHLGAAKQRLIEAIRARRRGHHAHDEDIGDRIEWALDNFEEHKHKRDEGGKFTKGSGGGGSKSEEKQEAKQETKTEGKKYSQNVWVSRPEITAPDAGSRRKIEDAVNSIPRNHWEKVAKFPIIATEDLTSDIPGEDTSGYLGFFQSGGGQRPRIKIRTMFEYVTGQFGGKVPVKDLTGTMVHELGHAVDFASGNYFSKMMSPSIKKDAKRMGAVESENAQYWMNSPREHFAELYKLAYHPAPDLRFFSPDRDITVFGGMSFSRAQEVFKDSLEMLKKYQDDPTVFKADY